MDLIDTISDVHFKKEKLKLFKKIIKTVGINLNFTETI